MKPVLLVIAGPNGGGKTTITARLREDHATLRKIYGDLATWVNDVLESLPRHPDFEDLRTA